MKFDPIAKDVAPIARLLPPDALKTWCEAANAAHDLGCEHNDCVRAGGDEVGKAWQRPATGKKWVRKDNPTCGDVHVDAPLDGKKPKRKEHADGDAAAKFETSASVVKVDESLGLVFGFAVVCKKDGADYYDVQGDHIPEDAMLAAAADFMENSRVAKDMHQGDAIGP